jgi:hypothetical protein
MKAIRSIADQGRQRPHASNRYDDFGGDLRSATFGFGHRSRRGHAATASDSHYFGPLMAQLPLVLIVSAVAARACCACAASEPNLPREVDLSNEKA